MINNPRAAHVRIEDVKVSFYGQRIHSIINANYRTSVKTAQNKIELCLVLLTRRHWMRMGDKTRPAVLFESVNEQARFKLCYFQRIAWKNCANCDELAPACTQCTPPTIQSRYNPLIDIIVGGSGKEGEKRSKWQIRFFYFQPHPTPGKATPSTGERKSFRFLDYQLCDSLARARHFTNRNRQTDARRDLIESSERRSSRTFATWASSDKLKHLFRISSANFVYKC